MQEQISTPPVQSVTPSSPPIKLWTPGFIAGVTFLLGFPAGIVIASINWIRMKLNNKALVHLLGGAAGTFIFVITLMFLSTAAARGIGLLANLGVLFYLRQQMSKDLENFKAANNGFENAGQLGGCLISLGVLAIFLIFVFGVAFVFAVLGIQTPQ